MIILCLRVIVKNIIKLKFLEIMVYCKSSVCQMVH